MCNESSSTHQSVFTTHCIKAVCRIMIAEKVGNAGPSGRKDDTDCGVVHGETSIAVLSRSMCRGSEEA